MAVHEAFQIQQQQFDVSADLEVYRIKWMNHDEIKGNKRLRFKKLFLRDQKKNFIAKKCNF